MILSQDDCKQLYQPGISCLYGVINMNDMSHACAIKTMEYKQILLYFISTIPILEVVHFQCAGSYLQCYDAVYFGSYAPTFQRDPLYAPSS
jgi:hypothetical protein